MTLAELADRLDCRLDGDGAATIVGVADLAAARPDQIALFAHPRYKADAAATAAGGVIVAEDAPALARPMLRAKSPFLAFARALALFHAPPRPAAGISPQADVAPDAIVDPTATVGPFVAIGAGARVGAGTILVSHVAIGAGAVVGRDCHLHAHVSIRDGCVLGDRVVVQNGAVIGSDGFGFTRDADGRHVKVPQIGIVVVEDDVEIGANTTIDRPAVGETRIKAGTKIDNLVQIAHGVVIGRNSLLAAQVGIAGSTIVGDSVMFGGQVGVGGHLEIGDRVKLAAKTGATGSIDADGYMSGYPMMETREWRRAYVVLRKLPEMRKQLLALEERLKKLEEK